MTKTKVKFHPETLILEGYKEKDLKTATEVTHAIDTESDIAIGEKALLLLRNIYPKATVKPVAGSVIEVKDGDEVQYFNINLLSYNHSDYTSYSAFNFDADSNIINEVQLGYTKDGVFVPVKAMPYKQFMENLEHPHHTRTVLKIAEIIGKETNPDFTDLTFKHILTADRVNSNSADTARELEILAEKPDNTLVIVTLVVDCNAKHNPENPTMYTGDGMTYVDQRTSDLYNMEFLK